MSPARFKIKILPSLTDRGSMTRSISQRRLPLVTYSMNQKTITPITRGASLFNPEG
jgi:hypothetical protein